MGFELRNLLRSSKDLQFEIYPGTITLSPNCCHCTAGSLAAAAAASKGLVLSRPVTFFTGNAKKLEEVRSILRNSIPYQSLKLDLPELQGELEDISKEKARLAAKVRKRQQEEAKSNALKLFQFLTETIAPSHVDLLLIH